MIDVAIITGSTRPGRKGEAAAGNHLGTPVRSHESSPEDHSQLSSRRPAPTHARQQGLTSAAYSWRHGP